MTRVSRLALVATVVVGCAGSSGQPDARGIVTGAAAETVTGVALAWFPVEGEVLQVMGEVPASAGQFDVDELLSLDLAPPQRTCDPDSQDAPTGAYPGLGVAWIVGFHEDTTMVDPARPTESADARSDDLVVVFASHDVDRTSETWSTFETTIGAGLSLMSKRWCAVWREDACRRLDLEPFCLEPVPEDVRVILRTL